MVKTFTLDDWAEVSAAQALFVRKVSTAASTPLLDRLDARAASLR